MDNVYAIIMAGGEGTRFYPLSTPECPKQFLNFIGDKTFIRQTFERVLPLISADRIYVSTSERYVGLVKSEFPELPSSNIIAEPIKKNTAPALAFSTHVIFERDEKATVLCLPSDHFIANETGFRNILIKATTLAKDGYLVTLGMKPTWPSPEYGYIYPKNSGEWSEVKQFAEKPDAHTAASYIENGYLWNGGIFIWQAKTFFDELNKYAPELAKGEDFPLAFSLSPLAYFRTVPAISIDCALMEKSNRVAVIPADIGWSDVGSWDSVSRLIDEGVDVSSKARAILKGDDLSPWRRIISKPWGHEELWAHTERYVGKTLFIRKGKRLSMQYHQVKEETLRLLSGTLLLELAEGNKRTMLPGDVHHIPPGAHHRMEAKTDCVVLEVSTPELDDVVRLSDDFGR